MAGLIAAALGGSTISAVSQLGSAAMQTGQQQSVINQGVNSFKAAGMPEFMYFSGQQMHMPNTNVSLGGSNFYNTTGVNLNTPTISNEYQQYNKTGKPGPVNFQPQSNTTPKTIDSTTPKALNSQRPGLGYSSNNPVSNFMAQGKPMVWTSSGAGNSNYQNVGSTTFTPRFAPNPLGTSSITHQMAALWDD